MDQHNQNEIVCMAVDRKPSDSALGNDEQIRIGLRLLAAAFFIMITIGVSEILMPASFKAQPWFNFVLWGLVFLGFFAGLFGINKIGIGMKVPIGRRVLPMLLLIFPYLNLLTLVFLYYRAARYLKALEMHAVASEEIS